MGFTETVVGAFPAGKGPLRVNLMTHLHLASNLRMGGAKLNFPPYAVRTHTVKTQPSHQPSHQPNKAAGNVNSLL